MNLAVMIPLFPALNLKRPSDSSASSALSGGKVAKSALALEIVIEVPPLCLASASCFETPLIAQAMRPKTLLSIFGATAANAKRMPFGSRR